MLIYIIGLAAVGLAGSLWLQHPEKKRECKHPDVSEYQIPDLAKQERERELVHH
jgi:hypothetical protein